MKRLTIQHGRIHDRRRARSSNFPGFSRHRSHRAVESVHHDDMIENIIAASILAILVLAALVVFPTLLDMIFY